MYRQKNKLYIWTLFIALFSCTELSETTKNSSKNQNGNNNEVLTIPYAQQWFNEHYKPVVSTRSSYESATIYLMKPKWENAKELKRKRFEVVEIPVMVNYNKLLMDKYTAERWKPDANSSFVRNTAKIVVAHDKNNDEIKSFFMVFVGSYGYLKETRSMGKNTYLYRQPDFDGMVLFYEINGTFVNGWKYSGGRITGNISPKTYEKQDVSKHYNTRVWVDDCYTDYIIETHELCEDDVSVDMMMNLE